MPKSRFSSLVIDLKSKEVSLKDYVTQCNNGTEVYRYYKASKGHPIKVFQEFTQWLLKENVLYPNHFCEAISKSNSPESFWIKLTEELWNNGKINAESFRIVTNKKIVTKIILDKFLEACQNQTSMR